MSKLVSEAVKIDVALTSASFTGAKTGDYFSLSEYGRALFVTTIGAMAAGKTSALQTMQAKDATGDEAEAITNNTATITANTGASEVTLTVSTVVADDEVTINGLTFAAGATEDLENRIFKAEVTDAATATSLAKAINHAIAGVPGVIAAADSAVVTLTASSPGESTITVTDAALTITPATVKAIGYVECSANMLDINNGFTHVALKITNSDSMPTSAILLRGDGRYNPIQQVAAAKIDASA